MSNDDIIYVGHICDTARKALGLVVGKTSSDYDEDELLRLALTHLIQVIGEAARHVSRQLRDGHPEIPWQEIVGMRHKVVHHYMNVDEDIVWRTVTQEIEPLVEKLESILPPEDNLG